MPIGHLDMDAFFARCEELRNPELEEKPLVICVYTREGESGAVSTSNYEARELGIGSGMPLKEARAKATEETVFLPVDHDYYREKSREAMSVLRSRSSRVQKASIDEAYFELDGRPVEKAKKIQAELESEGLSASIGIAPNKFLAKMASEEDKPGGLTRLREEEAEDFLREKSVGEIHGIGDATEKKLEDAGIETCGELLEAENALMVELFGKKKAVSMKAKASGEGSTELGDRERKQMSRIRTMPRNSSDYGFLKRQLGLTCRELWERVKNRDKAFTKVALVAIDTELNSYTRSRSVKTTESGERMFREADRLLQRLLSETDAEFRRIGFRVAGFVDKEKQTSLDTFALQ
ncbi:MAG: DNA polymerase IV [Candidatus Nanohaloarchaea archaeon]